MKKAQLVDAIIEKIDTVACNIVRVYGVPMGVGYDLLVTIEKTNGEVELLEAHASNKAWAVGGHLRPNQVRFDDYKGSNAPMKYADSVRRYWESKDGLREYYERYTKNALLDEFMGLS